MLRLAFDFIITWRETRTRPNAYAEFMKRRYEFRFNVQTGEAEFRERHSFCFRFQPVDKRALNSIALDA